jgi:alpha-ketoglutarate-dependent taurine dioxygenase
MSSNAFDLIAAEFPGWISEVGRLEAYLARRELGVAIDADSIADFCLLESHMVEVLMCSLANKSVAEERACWICDGCGSVQDKADEPLLECDECGRSTAQDRAESVRRWFLKTSVPVRCQPRTSNPMKNVNNMLTNVDEQRFARIVPWKALQEQEFLVDGAKLDSSGRDRALRLLEKYGLVLLRWHADEPTVARLESLEEWVGPARERQNDHVGKVKALRPDASAPATTGDSAKALPPHVDGTQDPITPAILGFQYVQGGSWGAESSFVDMAAALGSLEESRLQQVLESLSMSSCASCTKAKKNWTGRWDGALVRRERGGAVSIRLREDDLLTVGAQYQGEFDLLRKTIREWAAVNKTRLTPREGDVILFDNWRVLHGRAAVGGRAQRIHDRIWIDDLLLVLQGSFMLGIRPLSHSMLAAIQSNNLR